MNRRLFLAGTAAGVSALALPALASLPPAPFALEVASVVAMNLRWYLKDRYCRTWHTLDAVIPDHSIEIDLDRSMFGTTFKDFIDRCTRIAHQFHARLENKKQYLLFLHTSKFDHGYVFEDVAVQAKQVGNEVSIVVTFVDSNNHYRPMPFRLARRTK